MSKSKCVRCALSLLVVIVSASAAADPPPSNLTAHVETDRLQASWDVSPIPHTSYQVEVAGGASIILNTSLNFIDVPRPPLGPGGRLHVRVRAVIANLSIPSNWTAWLTISLPTPPVHAGHSRTASVAVGSIIGACSVLVLGTLLICGVIYYFKRMQRGTVILDTNIEWTMVNEYEWRINPEGLASLEPEVRSKLDLRLLARIANTDPNTLMMLWKAAPSPLEEERQGEDVLGELDSSIIAHSLGLPSHMQPVTLRAKRLSHRLSQSIGEIASISGNCRGRQSYRWSMGEPTLSRPTSQADIVHQPEVTVVRVSSVDIYLQPH